MKSYYLGKALTQISNGCEWSCDDNDLNTLIWHQTPKNSFTNEEVLALAKEIEVQEKIQDENKIAARASALAKLAALGLSADEIAAL
jgi:hypothetical protein